MTSRLASLFTGILCVLAPGSTDAAAGQTQRTSLATAIPEAGSARTLRLAVEVDPRTLDPAQMVSNEEAMLAGLCFHTLFEPGPGGTILPALAAALPEISEDGRTVTVQLRTGVRFANGRELEARDVVWTFERMFDPRTGAFCSVYFKSLAGSAAYTDARVREITATATHAANAIAVEPRSITGIQALGSHTVRFQLDRRDPCFLNYLTVPVCSIVPFDESPPGENRLAHHPLGTGPFVLTSWTRGARIRFSPNPHHTHGHPRQPTGVDVLVGIDRSTQAMMFERGELDFQFYPSDQDFHRFRRHPTHRSMIRSVAGTSPVFVFLNCEMPPFTNRLVRLAINHAIDKAQVARILGSRCVPARGPLPLSVTGFNQDLKIHAHDPARARTLLAEAGWPDGFASTLWTNRDDPRWVKIALLVQQSLREVGIRIEIKEVGYPTLLDAAGRRQTVPMGVFDCLAAIDDPQEIFDLMLNGENISAEACMNTAFYASPEVGQRLRASKEERRPQRRRELLREVERLVGEDSPWVFLVQFNTETLAQPWLKGYTPRGFWPPVSLRDCWIDR